MRYLLDTNACIVYLNQEESNVRRKMATMKAADIAVCSIVKAELFYGASMSRYPERTFAKQQKFLQRFASLPFDDAATRIHGRIRATLKAKGTPIGPYDSLVAAIALANNLILVTHNVREFSRIDGLEIEDWEAGSDAPSL